MSSAEDEPLSILADVAKRQGDMIARMSADISALQLAFLGMLDRHPEKDAVREHLQAVIDYIRARPDGPSNERIIELLNRFASDSDTADSGSPQ